MDRLRVLKNLGFSPSTILDIGAYHGNWSKMVHEIWPKAAIVMIEANADHLPTLSSIPWAHTEITLLGDKNQKSVNYYATQTDNTSGNSIFKEQTHVFDNCEIRKLPMTTLDEIVQKNTSKKIDFIKIDTQGSELSILKGGKETLKKTEFVLLETQILEYNLRAPNMLEIATYMEKIGFRVFDLLETHYIPTGELIQIDFLFAKNDSKFLKKGMLV